MRRLATIVLFGLVSLSGVWGGTSARSAPSERWPVCGEWREVTLREGWGQGHVNDVDVVSPYDAWLVSDRGEGDYNESFVYRWDGLRWSEVPFPTPRHSSTSGDAPNWTLTGIVAVSSDEVWAVGWKRVDVPITARWDGTRWRLVPIGLPGVRGHLDAVTRIAGTTKLWAVGQGLAPIGQRPLALRWSGAAWHRVATPRVGRWAEFTDIVSLSDTTAVVGQASIDGRSRMVFGRWTGSTWVVRTGPTGYLDGIDGVSADVMWAVGGRPASADGWSNGVVMRWDGTRWRSVLRLDARSHLYDVVAASPAVTWAVGVRWEGGRPWPVVVRRGSPTGWARATAPRVEGAFTAIGGTPHDLWAFLLPYESDVGSFTPFHRC